MNDTSWTIASTSTATTSLPSTSSYSTFPTPSMIATSTEIPVISSSPSLEEILYYNATDPPKMCFFRETTENYVIAAAFTTIFLLSVLGNALVLVVILTQRAMRSITNIYLVNLAISDLMLSVICMPSTLVSMVVNCWMFGAIMCKVLAYLQPMVVTASAYTLAVIAIERYYAICRPLHSRIWQTRSHAYFMISLVWLIAIVANVLCLFMYEQQSYNITGLTCAPIHEPWKHFAYQVYMTAVLLMVPLALMTVLYGSVIKSLRTGIKMDIAATEGSMADNENSLEDCDGGDSRKPSLINKISAKISTNGKVKTSTSSPPRKETALLQSVRSTHTQKNAAAKQRVVKMLIVIVIIFFCCWTPSYIWWLMLLAGDSFPGAMKVWNSDVNTFITVLTYLSSCTNPITYCFLNKKFRTAMLTTFGKKKLIRQHFQKVYLPTNGAFAHAHKNGANAAHMNRSMSSNCNLQHQIDKEAPLRRSNSNIALNFENTDCKTKLIPKERKEVFGRETNC